MIIAATALPFGVYMAAFIIGGALGIFLYAYLLGPWVAMAMTRRFVRKARDGEIQVETYTAPKRGESIAVQYRHWTVTPNTGLNRVLLSNARKHGMVKVGLYGRIRYYGVER